MSTHSSIRKGVRRLVIKVALITLIILSVMMAILTFIQGKAALNNEVYNFLLQEKESLTSIQRELGYEKLVGYNYAIKYLKSTYGFIEIKSFKQKKHIKCLHEFALNHNQYPTSICLESSFYYSMVIKMNTFKGERFVFMRKAFNPFGGFFWTYFLILCAIIIVMTAIFIFFYREFVSITIDPFMKLYESVSSSKQTNFLSPHLELNDIFQKIKSMQKKQLENQEKLLTLEQENAVNKAIASMVRMIVHDVRRPFDKINRLLERANKKQPSELKKYFETVSHNIHYDTKQVDAMLQDLMDIGHKKRNLNLKLICLKSILNSVYQEVNENQVEFFIESNKTTITGDEFKLKRCFENILSNAIQAPGGKRYYVEIQDCIHENKAWTKVVLGNIGGSYISEERLPKIFKLFYTEKKENGRGLGLAICKKIINDHGGKIWGVSNGYTSFEEKIPTRSKEKNYVEFHILLKRDP